MVSLQGCSHQERKEDDSEVIKFKTTYPYNSTDIHLSEEFFVRLKRKTPANQPNITPIP